MATRIWSSSLFLLLALPVCAEVLDSTPQGFAVRTVVTTKATPEKVWQSLAKVGEWWDKDHTWSGNASNLTLELRANGCFCEKLANGEVRHAVVIYVDAGKTLRLSGGLGPLQALAVTGTWSLTFAAIPEGGTKIESVYLVGGYMKGGLQPLAAPVDEVMAIQTKRLGAWAER